MTPGAAAPAGRPPPSGTRRIARLAALAGALAVGWFLLDARPRVLDLVYDLEGVTGARALVVEIGDGAKVVRRAEFRGPSGQVRHRVKLRQGSYALAWSLVLPDGILQGERALEVEAEQTVVLRLGP